MPSLLGSERLGLDGLRDPHLLDLLALAVLTQHLGVLTRLQKAALLGREFGRAGRTDGAPFLKLYQLGAADQEILVAAFRQPARCHLGDVRVFPYPQNVDGERRV